MIRKILETFFRHRLLILLPPVLIPLIAGPVAFLTAQPYYETWVGIWVDRPAYIKSNDDANRYTTPAQNQADRLNQMLRTHTFLMDVARRTSLGPLVGSESGEGRIQNIMQRNVAVLPSGNNLLFIRSRAATRELSFEVVDALVRAFKEKATAERGSQAELATSFYEARLQEAEDQLAKSNEELRRYVAANPRLMSAAPVVGPPSTTSSSRPGPSAVVDPQFAELRSRVDLDDSVVERARTSLEQARLEAAAALQGQELGFQVVDPPKMPTKSISERKKILLIPAAGLLVGLGLGAVLLVLLVAADRSVRSETDLAPIARVVGIVPRLRLERISKPAGLDATRRAMGFVAGATPPAPPGAR